MRSPGGTRARGESSAPKAPRHRAAVLVPRGCRASDRRAAARPRRPRVRRPSTECPSAAGTRRRRRSPAGIAIAAGIGSPAGLRRGDPALRGSGRVEIGLGPGGVTKAFVGSGLGPQRLITGGGGAGAVGGRRRRLGVDGRGHPATDGAPGAGLGSAEALLWVGPRPDVERWYAAA